MSRESTCTVKAKGCMKKFIKRTDWQKTCNNPECRKELKRRNAKSWYKDHKERRKKYLTEYANL